MATRRERQQITDVHDIKRHDAIFPEEKKKKIQLHLSHTNTFKLLEWGDKQNVCCSSDSIDKHA